MHCTVKRNDSSLFTPAPASAHERVVVRRLGRVPEWQWAGWQDPRRLRCAAPSWCLGSLSLGSPRTYAAAPWRRSDALCERTRSIHTLAYTAGKRDVVRTKLETPQISPPLGEPPPRCNPAFAIDLIRFTETAERINRSLRTNLQWRRLRLFIQMSKWITVT